MDSDIFIKWMKHFVQFSNCSRESPVLLLLDIVSIVREPYTKALPPFNIQKGFQVVGIEPFNTKIFENDEYLPSSVTDSAAPDTVTTIPIKNVKPETTLAHVDDMEPEIIILHVETNILIKVSATVASITSPEVLKPYPK